MSSKNDLTQCCLFGSFCESGVGLDYIGCCFACFDGAFHEALPSFGQMFACEGHALVRAPEDGPHVEPLPRAVEGVGAADAVLTLPGLAF